MNGLLDGWMDGWRQRLKRGREMGGREREREGGGENPTSMQSYSLGHAHKKLNQALQITASTKDRHIQSGRNGFYIIQLVIHDVHID